MGSICGKYHILSYKITFSMGRFVDKQNNVVISITTYDKFIDYNTLKSFSGPVEIKHHGVRKHIFSKN